VIGIGGPESSFMPIDSVPYRSSSLLQHAPNLVKQGSLERKKSGHNPCFDVGKMFLGHYHETKTHSSKMSFSTNTRKIPVHFFFIRFLSSRAAGVSSYRLG